MTNTNPRDLIQRLVDIADALDGRKPLVFAQGQVMDGFTALANFRALANEARAFLSQPEPEGLTDEPLGDLMDKWVEEAFRKKPYGCKHPTHTYVACKAFEHGRNLAARTALSQPEPEWPTVMEIIALADEIEAEGLGKVDLVRRALARWGRPKPPSLKEQALHVLGSPITIGESRLIGHLDHDLLRLAVEALPDD